MQQGQRLWRERIFFSWQGAKAGKKRQSLCWALKEWLSAWTPGYFFPAIPNDLIKYINSLHKPCFTQKLQLWTFLSANQSYSLITVSQRGKENPLLLLWLHSISQLSGGLLQPRLCDQAFWFPPASLYMIIVKWELPCTEESLENLGFCPIASYSSRDFSRRVGHLSLSFKTALS